MSRTAVLLLTLSVLAVPARGDDQMKQSPLLMRRAGPSCRPGDLGGQAGAGYFYRLGPCAGSDASAAPDATRDRGTPARRYRF